MPSFLRNVLKMICCKYLFLFMLISASLSLR